MKDGRSNHSHIADRCVSFMMKTELIALCTMDIMISCNPAFCRNFCKGSYSSGDLNDNEALIAIKDGTSSIVGYAGRSIRVLIGNSTIFVGRKEISSCSETNLAVISCLALADHQLLALVLDLQQPLLSYFLKFSPCQLGALYIQSLDRCVVTSRGMEHTMTKIM